MARVGKVTRLLMALALGACTPPAPPDTAKPAPPAAKPVAVAVVAAGESASEQKRTPQEEVVAFHLYVMSHCPYGMMAEDTLAPVFAKLGARVAVDIDYIGEVDAQGVLRSMHGPDEVDDDIVQVCARRSPRLVPFILCQNRRFRAKQRDWRACAEEVGIPVEPVRACAESDEGRVMLAESFARSRLRRATGSPTFYIGEQKYAGGRRGRNFMRAICDAYTSGAPVSCRDIPPPVEVAITVLVDKRCEDCNVARQEGQLKAAVEAPVLRELDYGDPEGKALYTAIAPTTLPVAVFDSSLDRDAEAHGQLARALRQVGGYQVLPLGGGWSPVCSDKGGCARAECKGSLQCRPETPRKLELFIMSHCPFAAKAVASMPEVWKTFGDATLDFSLHFIGDHGSAGLTSMHGPTEIDDDLREVCAERYYGPRHKFMDFVGCRAADYKNPNWQGCTGGTTGFDEKLLSGCADGAEGTSLLDASFTVAQRAGIGASPTWVVNGRHKFAGVDADTVKKNVCRWNPQLKPCAQIAGPSPNPKPQPQPQNPPPSCGGPTPSNPTALPGSCGP